MAETLLGSKIGHFRIVDLIAKGGMGEVYAGYDETLERKVALKSIRPEYRLHDEARARFLREARILSQLGHPNICQIYDYIEGEQSDFLVLELISGKSLGQALKKGIDFDLKMRIAKQLAAVLVAAHDKGVIHRDLKPDNVMLTEDDRVKVLDFGLSQLRIDEITRTLAPPLGEEGPQLKPSVSETEASQLVASDGIPAQSSGRAAVSSVNLTAIGAVMGTLGYMSPEQARGEVTTAASDMYSFGLLLQELFTGKAPFEKDLDPAAMLQNAMAGKTLAVEGIDADLAALIGRLKSLSPGTRPSAVDTAEKLVWIRQKPLRRRKKFLVAAAIVVLTLFGVAMTILAIRATRAERAAMLAGKAAKQEAETSKQVSDFLVGLFKVSDPGESKGNTVTARELLDKGATKIEKELKDQPEVQARLMDIMGVVYYRLGLYRQAQPLLEASLAIREKTLGPDHLDVAKSLNDLANLYGDQGKYAEAEPLYQRSLKIYEKALGPNDVKVAKSLINLANLYLDQARYAEAESLYQRSLKIREKALGPDHPDVVSVLNNLANLYVDQGKYVEAEPLRLRALKIDEKVLGPDHPDIAGDLNNLANVYRDQARYAEAESLYQRSLKICEKALGPDHPHVARVLNNLAALFVVQGKYAEAEPLYQRSLKIREKALGPDHPDVASVLNNLAVLYFDQGKYAEAEPLYQRCLKIREKTLGPDHPHVATALSNLANLYRKQGRYAEAEPLYQRSLTISEKALGPDHPDVAYVLYRLGCLRARQGKRAEALAFLRRALPAGGDKSWMRSIGKEPDLVSLHGDPKFERIVADVNKRGEPKR